MLMNRNQADAYRAFWGEMAAAHHATAVPPPPMGDVVEVLNTAASLPAESVGLNRIAYLAWGLGVGLLLGLLAAIAKRWPNRTRKLVGFAVAGCILAGAASFLIPNRYTSTALMQITPAQITEDPLLPLPTATPASEFLRQIEPEVLSFQKLSRIIEDRRLNLYPTERRTKPMEEVVRNMLANDLRIVPVIPSPATKGTVSAFSISFSYSDRFKAQQAAQLLINRFYELDIAKAKLNGSRSPVLHQITQRKAGEILDVLDTPSLPSHPVKPNRPLIAALGLLTGLLLGAITLFLRRPRSPELVPA